MELFVWMILLPLLAAPVVYLIGRLTQNTRRYGQPVALLVMLISWGIFLSVAADSTPVVQAIGEISLRMDGIAKVVAGLTLTLGTLVVMYSGPYMQDENHTSAYYALLLAMIGVTTGLGCASDLFNMWLWFEAMAVTSYVLVAFYRTQPESLEAGVKYLVQSASGSVLVVVGIALVLAVTGTLSLDALPAAITDSPLLRVAGGLMVIGFGVKAALVPLHTWLPDAHSQAPGGISAMLSGIIIEGGLIAMLRALTALAGVTPDWGALLMSFGVLNMVVGNLLAFRQTQVKRLLAYSSLVHMGYMLVGLGVALYAGQAAGAQGGFFHLISHGLMKGLAFLAAGALVYSLHITAGSHAPLTIAELNGAAQKYPLTALAFSLAVLGLGGLPPLVGFMSKWQIFVGGISAQNNWITLVVIFAALNSIFSLSYYAPLVSAMYRKNVSPAVAMGTRMPLAIALPIILLALAILITGLWPGGITWLTDPAGQALLAALGA